MAILNHQQRFDSLVNCSPASTINRHRSLPTAYLVFFRQPQQTRTSLRRRSSPLLPHATRNAIGTVGDTTGDAFTKYSGYLFNLSGSDFDSVTEYDLKKIASLCRRNPFILLRRLVQTGATLGKWFAVRYLDSYLKRSDQMFQVRASELRNILTELGPAYIKIAQAVSSRPDLISPTYLEELSLLQDRIAPFSTEMAFDTIEAELGSTMNELFFEISPVPIAAASLGQVYQARLRPCGKVVAIKVQRPGVQAAISLDMFILRFFAGLIRKAAKLNTDLQAVVDEWASSLFREMDYTREAKNGIKFRQLYGGLEDVMVPEMYLEKTTRRVLVMEWVEGQRLSEVKDLYLVEVGVYCSLNQLLEYGFYHADPHPGNLIRTSDRKLAYIDFGMMGEFKLELREGFIEACLHLINRDFYALSNDFVTLGLLPPTAERDAVTNALTSVFQNAVDKGVRNISFGDLLGNLGRTMYKFKFQLPSYFSLVIRSLAVLEGIAISSNPDYKVLGSTYPWIARKVLTDSSPQLRSSLQALIYQDGVFRIDRLESLLAESLRAKTEKVSDKSQTEDIDSKKLVKQILSFTLDDKGTFVREILLQELAKGLDALGMATIDSSVPFTSSPLMTEEDYTNLSNLQRLSQLLSGFQTSERSTKEVGGLSPYNSQIGDSGAISVLNNLASFQEILPVISVIPELSPESQQQLLHLPVDLAGKLISRVAARTLRRIFL